MKLLIFLMLTPSLALVSAQSWQAPLAPNCLAVPLPSSTWGAAGAADLATTITMSTGGLPAVVLCPGITYDLSVRFPQARRYIVAVSQGNLSPQSSPSCPGRFISSAGSTIFTSKLALTCDATGYVYVDAASVDASLTQSSQYQRMKLPYAISPVAACLTSPCSKEFTLKTFTDALTTAKSFPDAAQSLAATWGGGLENVGRDILNNLVTPLGLPNELKALTSALQMIGSTFNTGTGTVANPAQFLVGIKQLSTLFGGNASSELPALLHALTTLGIATTTAAGNITATGIPNISLPQLLAAMQIVGKFLNPSASTTVNLPNLVRSGQGVITTMMALFPQAGSTASVAPINVLALLNFAQAVGGLFCQLGALGTALSG